MHVVKGFLPLYIGRPIAGTLMLAAALSAQETNCPRYPASIRVDVEQRVELYRAFAALRESNKGARTARTGARSIAR